MLHSAIPDELLGLKLHGDGLDELGLAAWYADEADGYAQVAGAEVGPLDALQEPCHANRFHAFRFLPQRQFECCLALGAASGREYAPLAGKVGRYIAIEPGRAFWRETIAGAPADYRAPSVTGVIDLPDGTCDLACSFGVLHHIANVGDVLCEVARVLKPGGWFVLREPITSLGDFRSPRPGLTRNERGIPHAMMDRLLVEAGFVIRHRRMVNFPGSREIPWKLGLKSAWDNPVVVRLDAVLAGLMSWNARYWRPRLIDKLAPRAVYWVVEKA